MATCGGTGILRVAAPARRRTWWSEARSRPAEPRDRPRHPLVEADRRLEAQRRPRRSHVGAALLDVTGAWIGEHGVCGDTKEVGDELQGSEDGVAVPTRDVERASG